MIDAAKAVIESSPVEHDFRVIDRNILTESRVDLKVYGMPVMELATTLIAVDKMGGGKVAMNRGNVAHLVGADASMNAAASINTPEAKKAMTESTPAVADLATNADTQLLRFSHTKPNLRILFNVARGLYSVVARRSAGINSIADLRGKRVGTWPNTSAHYYLVKELEAHGMAEGDVELVALAPIFELSKAIIEKRVDAIAIWEPGGQAAKDNLGEEAIELRTPGVYFEHFNLNSTAEKIANPEKRKQIVELIRHIIRATNSVKNDPQIGVEALARWTGYDRGQLERSFLHGHSWVANIAEDQLDVLVDQDAWIGRNEGRAGRSREELSKLIDYSLYEEALATM